ncbi:MAG: 16S rRNA processing protein RimM [Bacilli bacterium]|nr:16S rRNA processing protein RimM [Bacilli bacterium]
MGYINIGKIVNTHGIKGEVRILSSFSDKSIFNVSNILYIGNNKEKMKITSYRVHKNYDMVTFEGINDINDVLKYKSEDVFINRDDIDKFIIEDLIGYEVYGNSYIGKVKELISNIKYVILVLDNNTMIPYIDEFILNIDNDNKKIYIKEIEGLINED